MTGVFNGYCLDYCSTHIESTLLCIMAIRVVEFSNRRYKIRNIFAEESIHSKEIIEFLNWLLVESAKELIGRCQKVLKFDFQSQFSMSKLSESFSILFSLKNINSGAFFCYWHFLITSIFKSLYLLNLASNVI